MKSLATKTKSSSIDTKKTAAHRTSSVGQMSAATRAQVRNILRPHGLQPKLTIGRSGDRYEQEADAVADRIVAGLPVPEISSLASGNLQTQPIEEEEELLQPKVQRQTLEDEEEEEELIQPRLQRQPMEEEEEELQAKGKAGGNVIAGNDIAGRIDSLKGSGSTLSGHVRHYFTSRFGHDFSRVKVHTDADAMKISEDINARAFTVGQHVFFGPGQYNPATDSGRRLLGHELTHTVQQGAVQPLQKDNVIQRDIRDGLNDAMEGWGTDEDAIFSLTRNASPAEKQAVLDDVDVMARLDSELGRADMLQVLANLDAPVERRLQAAMAGMGTDEQTLFDLTLNASPAEKQRILDDDDLMADLDSELNIQDMLRVLENLNAPLSLCLLTAMSGWFTDIETIRDLFVNADPQQRLDVLNDTALVQSLVLNLGLEELINILILAGVDPVIIIQQLENAGFMVDLRGHVESVEWTGGHTLTAYGSELRVNPQWTPGAADHAAAYTQSASQALDVNIAFDQVLVPVPNIWVKGTFDSSEFMGTGSLSGDSATLSLGFSGLPDSDHFGQQDYSINWETSTDNTTWRAADISGPHHIYWLVGSPNWTLYSLAAEKATSYTHLDNDPATAVRMGINGEITYEESDDIFETNPLSMYAGGGHVCADFANLLTALAESIGLSANPQVIFGGILASGEMIWVRPSGFEETIFHVMPGNRIFSYHAVSDIGGTLQDAALNRIGVSADAIMSGVSLRFLDLSAAVPPSGVVGTVYSHQLTRTPTPVDVQYKPFPNLLTNTSVTLFPVDIPLGTTGIVNMTVAWSVSAGSLPPGLHLLGGTGLIFGTPTTAGTYTFTIQVDGGAGFIASRPLSITIT